jgi:hypothetical protein
MDWPLALAYTGSALVLAALIIAGIFFLENGSGTNPPNSGGLRFSWRRRPRAPK